MIVTRHGEKRTRKRVGVNRSAVEKMARKALANGVARHETKGGLRRYLDYLYHYNKSAEHMRVWGEKVWLFTDKNILITVLDLPRKYKNRANSIVKKGDEPDARNSEPEETGESENLSAGETEGDSLEDISAGDGGRTDDQADEEGGTR